MLSCSHLCLFVGMGNTDVLFINVFKSDEYLINIYTNTLNKL